MFLANGKGLFVVINRFLILFDHRSRIKNLKPIKRLLFLVSGLL